MLNDADLAALAADVESDRAERKSSLTGEVREKLGQAICAFANDLPGHGKPGVIFVGVNNDGHPTGLPITDELLLQLGGFRSDGNVLPIPMLTVQKRQLGGVDVAVVEVAPAPDPPVRYRGVVWIRVGPRRGTATRDEERILNERRRHGALQFDQHGVAGARLDDLDTVAFQRDLLPALVAAEVLEQNQRSLEEQLLASHFMTPDGLPTVAAILLCGRDPQFWLPGAYVQFVRYEGADLTSAILDDKVMSGTVVNQLVTMDELVKLNIQTAVDVGSGVTEQRSPDYPVVAVQQLTRNGLLHRNYETSNAPVQVFWFAERVEIHSPGGLFGRTTPENFGQPGGNDYRNPTLAGAMKSLGFVQRFGMGIPLARKSCADNGNPPPEFVFQGATFLALLRRRP